MSAKDPVVDKAIGFRPSPSIERAGLLVTPVTPGEALYSGMLCHSRQSHVQ